jgi:hypothetical protein
VKKDSKAKVKTVKKTCLKCEKEKKLQGDFFLSNSNMHSDGRFPVCKECLLETIDINTIKTVQEVLTNLNRPFLVDLWNSSIEEGKRTGKDNVFGLYIKNVQLNYKTLTWNDSVFEERTVRNIDMGEPTTPKLSNTFVVTDEIITKWGYGYTPEEYRAFESKYHMLKNNYQEKTAMHTEALLTYIRYRVKEELSTAKGEVKDAKEWGQLAQKAAQDAKINPSQLSKSDLSDGLDTFGQLVRSVEQAVDIIPILPKFRERPQDKVDFTLWCYINYVRDLKGMPLATYEEIYSFYDQRKKDFESSAGAFDGEL